MVRVVQPLVVALAFVAIAMVSAAGGCSGHGSGSGFPTSGGSSSGGGSSGASSGDDGSAQSSSGGSSGFSVGGSSGSSGGAPTCTGGATGWKCKVNTTCGTPTTLTGKVYDPAKLNPLYNVVVFIPNDPATLPHITQGTKTCNTCDVSIGNYVAATQTDASGSFTLKGVPTGKGVPVTVQIGKWRRTTTVDINNDCASNMAPDKSLHLPGKRADGDMPQMAISTGGLDNLGCFLYKMGIDGGEFSAPHAGGRLDVYQGVTAPGGFMIGTGPGLTTGTPGNCTNASCPLWNAKASLEAYDIVLLACEGDTYATSKPAGALTAMHDWLDEGGKVFATHFHYYWFQNGPAPFPGTAMWKGTSVAAGSGSYDIDSTFPKGMVYKQWLANVGVASATGGTIALNAVADSVGTVSATPPQATVRWIYDPNGNDVKYLSFGTPIGGAPPPPDAGAEAQKQYCGKAVFSDLHAGGAPAGDLPGACAAGALTDQEKALEFLFFDLSACVSNDTIVPPPPPPPPQ
jgi:hypothetical protein